MSVSIRDASPEVGVHPDRVVGGDRDHRRVDRPAVARRAGGARGGAAVAMHEQPEADRPGLAQLRERQDCFPPAGQSSNYQTAPPQNQYVDGAYSVFPRILTTIEGGATYNALNFSLDYNDSTGANFTGASQVRQRLPLPVGGSPSGAARDSRGERPERLGL